MQKYWMMYEYTDSEMPQRSVQRGYGLVRDGNDAVRRAAQNIANIKTATLLRVWVTFLESDNPVHTLIFGDVPKQGREMPIDNPTKSMVKSYNQGKGNRKERKQKQKEKPRVRVPVEAVKDTTPPWRPYTIVTSETYSKQLGEATNG